MRVWIRRVSACRNGHVVVWFVEVEFCLKRWRYRALWDVLLLLILLLVLLYLLLDGR